MNINDTLTKQVSEVKYLAVENSYRYRVIMRYFYEQHEKYTHWLYKEDVYGEMIRHDIYQGYTMEQCMSDLEMLKEWQSLYAIQDTSKVQTIEEFKNRQYRYQLTEYAVEIERMVMKLENLFIEGTSLQPTLLERIKETLKQTKTMVDEDIQTIGLWWNDLDNDFKRLNQTYQDYIRAWQSIKAEEMMKSISFMSQKDKFVEYLRNFVKQLHNHVAVIEGYLLDITQEEEDSLLNQILTYEKGIPRVENMEIADDIRYDYLLGKWTSLKRWFITSGDYTSESEKLFDMTNEIIRKITRYAANIIEFSNKAANRKEEYKHIAKLFHQCDTIDQANCLSAYVFGIQRPKHLKGNCQRETESINVSVYEEKPYFNEIKPRIRSFREKIERNRIIERTKEKEEALKKILEERKREEYVISTYSQEGILDFSMIKDIEPTIRMFLLKWVTVGLMNQSGDSKTENGIPYKIENPKEQTMCELECVDGILTMPAYRIQFMNEE